MAEVKNITVIGAGIIGLTTAYYLAKDGHNVTVLEKAEAVATGASAANGFQLSYAYLMPPFTLKDIFKQTKGLLFGTNPKTAISHIDRKSILQNTGWFLSALYQAFPAKYKRNYETILKLGQQSHFLLKAFLAEDGKAFKFDYSEQGKLVVFDKHTHFNQSLKNAYYATINTGYTFERQNIEQCYKHAPFLKTMNHGPLVGGVYCHNDYAGDCPKFCAELQKLLQKTYSVTFKFNHDITDLKNLEADAIVVCAGAYSKKLLKSIGKSAPIYPVKGYSYTLDKCADQNAYVTYKAKGMVMSDMGQTTRVSGFADFVGFDSTHDATRKAALLQNIKGFFPKKKLKILQENSGFRPITPNGLPVIKKVAGNVYVNIGHGMFGWTLAHATAFKTAELIRKG